MTASGCVSRSGRSRAHCARMRSISVEGHEQGFRKSPEFGDFFAAVKPFFDHIQEMRHYDAIESA